VKEKQIDT